MLLVATWVVLLGYAYVRARESVLSDDAETRTSGIVIGFILANAVYVYLVSTLFELGENYRYRFLIEPLFFVLLATAIVAFVRRVRARAAPG
jgi:hypothetical protein